MAQAICTQNEANGKILLLASDRNSKFFTVDVERICSESSIGCESANSKILLFGRFHIQIACIAFQ